MLGHGTTAQRLGEHTVEPAGAVSHGTHCKGKTGVRAGPPQLFSSLECLVAVPAIGGLCRSLFLSLRRNKKDAEIGSVLFQSHVLPVIGGCSLQTAWFKTSCCCLLRQ